MEGGGCLDPGVSPFVFQYLGGIDTTITDSTGKYPLTITPGTGSITTVGGALRIASNAYAQSAGNCTELASASYFEIEFDLNYTSGSPGTVFSKWLYGSQGGVLIDVFSSTLRIYLAGSLTDGGDIGSNIANADAGTTRHWKIVYDGALAQASRVKVWKDGAPVTFTAAAWPATLPNSNSKITIGKWDGLAGRAISADLDNFTLKVTRP